MKDLKAYDVIQDIKDEMNEVIEDNNLNDIDIGCNILTNEDKA